MFGNEHTVEDVYYSRRTLRNVQSILCLSELKTVKPNDARWLSHKWCVQAILEQLPSLIVNLHSLYGDYNDAKAYGLPLVLGSYRGVATIIFISVILDLLAKLYGFCREEPYIPVVYLFSSRSSYLTGDT